MDVIACCSLNHLLRSQSAFAISIISRGALGASFGGLRQSWNLSGCYGTLLGRSRTALGTSWAALGPLEKVLEGSWGIWGASWADVKAAKTNKLQIVLTVADDEGPEQNMVRFGTTSFMKLSRRDFKPWKKINVYPK